MRNRFDNLQSYPSEQLQDIVFYLKTRDLYASVCSEHYRRGNYFLGSDWILLPKKIFDQRNYANILPLYKEARWQPIYKLTRPLVNFLSQQVSSIFGGTYAATDVEFNIMPPKSEITPHVDQHKHSDVMIRAHMVIYTNDHVLFSVDEEQRHFVDGDCFVFDNKKMHSVINSHPTESRCHLVVDFTNYNGP
jgi:hypothetical protein